MELALYFETIHTVLTLGRKQRTDIFLVLFTTVMLILVTVSVSSSTVLHEAVCQITGDYPDGSAAYWASETTTWYITLGRAAIFMLQLMSDAQLVS